MKEVVKTVLTIIHLGDHLSDTFYGSVVIFGVGTIIESGTYSVDFDAYGKLITNSATYDTTVKIHSVTTRKDSIILTLAGIYTIITIEEKWEWYVPPSVVPVFSISDITIDSPFGSTPKQRTVSVMKEQPVKPVTAGIFKGVTASACKVGPNPVREMLYVQAPSDDNWVATLTSVQGLESRTVNFSGSSGQINVSGMSKGIYLLKVTGSSGSFSEKIVVE